MLFVEAFQMNQDIIIKNPQIMSGTLFSVVRGCRFKTCSITSKVAKRWTSSLTTFRPLLAKMLLVLWSTRSR